MHITVIISYAISSLELIAAFFALIHYKKYAQSTERYFLHFLWFTFFMDTIMGSYVGPYLKINNTWIYLFYTGLSFTFYCWWYYQVLQKRIHKIISAYLLIIYIFTFVISINNHQLQKYLFIIGAFFVLVLTGFHLHQLSNSDYTLKIKHKLSFWISTALVLFNVGMFPLVLLSDYFDVRMNNTIFNIVLFFLNLILYTCFIIGFIWTKKKYNHF